MREAGAVSRVFPSRSGLLLRVLELSERQSQWLLSRPASLPTFASAAALRLPARCRALACGHLALGNAIERLVQSLADPPGLAASHHGARGVRMVWARRSSLTPCDFGLGQVLLKDFGDPGDQPWADESAWHEVPSVGDASRFGFKLIGPWQPRQRSRQLAWLEHAEGHAVEAVDDGNRRDDASDRQRAL